MLVPPVLLIVNVKAVEVLTCTQEGLLMEPATRLAAPAGFRTLRRLLTYTRM